MIAPRPTGFVTHAVHGLVMLICLLLSASGAQAQAERFVGSYTGSAEVQSADGSLVPRDMSVTISETKEGFNISWTSITYRPDGRAKEKSYSISFVPTDREDVYAAAMRRNVFGHEVQLNPMEGEPYVWARIIGDTLSLYSLFVDPQGGYEIQQFDRTLADGGLQLEFQSVRNGKVHRRVSSFLKKQ